MRFRPCIDLYKGAVHQIVGSTFSDDPGKGPRINFRAHQSAAYYASLYRADRLSGGHVIRLGPGNDEAAVEALAAFPGGMQVGGGITPANAPSFLDAGASHVIVTSFVFRDGFIHRDKLKAMSKAAGKDRLVLDISCTCINGAYHVVTDRWQHISASVITAGLLEELSVYCDEFLVHAAGVEGKQRGIDHTLVALLGEHTPLPTTYAGGIRNIDDLELIKTVGRDRIDATIGSALDIFGGSLSYRSVVAWHNRNTSEK